MDGEESVFQVASVELHPILISRIEQQEKKQFFKDSFILFMSHLANVVEMRLLCVSERVSFLDLLVAVFSINLNYPQPLCMRTKSDGEIFIFFHLTCIVARYGEVEVLCMFMQWSVKFFLYYQRFAE